MDVTARTGFRCYFPCSVWMLPPLQGLDVTAPTGFGCYCPCRVWMLLPLQGLGVTAPTGFRCYFPCSVWMLLPLQGLGVTAATGFRCYCPFRVLVLLPLQGLDVFRWFWCNKNSLCSARAPSDIKATFCPKRTESRHAVLRITNADWGEAYVPVHSFSWRWRLDIGAAMTLVDPSQTLAVCRVKSSRVELNAFACSHCTGDDVMNVLARLSFVSFCLVSCSRPSFVCSFL